MIRFRRLAHCTCLLLAWPALATAQPAGPAKATNYTVFFRGTPLGRESVRLMRDASGTTIAAEGRLSAPLNVTIRAAEFKYRPDWSPISFNLDATINGGPLILRTTFADNVATTEGTQGTTPVRASQPISPQALIHVNGIFSSYVALAQRLAGTAAGAELRVFVVPQLEIAAHVKAVQRQRMQIGTTFLDVQQYELAFDNPTGSLATSLTVADDGTLLRVSVGSEGIDFVREDVAASTSRTQIYSNPGDEAVVIPSVGFNLGATITRPQAARKTAGAASIPAVVLLSGSGVGDRDGMALGVPTLAQLAGAIADAGMIAVRYDQRGNGQSGGRSESATLSDFADDARVVVRWLEKQPDVDRKKIAVIGHAEGAWVALLAASREKRIAAVVSLEGPSSTGAELVLEQQQHALDQMQITPEERAKRIELQKQIQTAVLTGKGWESIPVGLRKTADTPWLQSLLSFNPSRVIEDVKQPLLIVHGALDRQVPVAHAEHLADLARKEGKSKSVELVIVRGVNHVLLPAVTGEVSEYATLEDRNISKDVTTAATGWLAKTFASIR